MLSIRRNLDDDRGRRVSIATTTDASAVDIDIYRLPKPPTDDQAKYRLRAKEYFSLGTLMIGLTYWPLHHAVTWYFHEQLGVNKWITSLCTAFALLPLLWFSYAISQRSIAGIVRDILRHSMYCPSCCFTLKEVQAESDGCTVCPECGAAWQLPTQNETEPRAQA